ncbi:MAG: membrane protein FxsA [Candidatus Omnitrophica bacterium]|nr:membrane protein FxsA [Candidatus Omnitrophota bacterium]
MFLYLVLLFTVIPATEIFIFIKLGESFGIFNTFLLVIVTGVLGAHIARHQGFRVIQSIQNELNKGNMPTEQMIDGAMILVGGLTLLTPGLLTDIFGFLLLIPLTRTLLKAWLRKKFKTNLNSGSRIIEVESISSENMDDETPFGA